MCTAPRESRCASVSTFLSPYHVYLISRSPDENVVPVCRLSGRRAVPILKLAVMFKPSYQCTEFPSAGPCFSVISKSLNTSIEPYLPAPLHPVELTFSSSSPLSYVKHSFAERRGYIDYYKMSPHLLKTAVNQMQWQSPDSKICRDLTYNLFRAYSELTISPATPL